MKSLKGVKGETIPDEIETIYDHGLTEEERQWFGPEILYPKTKEEYLQRLRERYRNPKSLLSRIWEDLFTLYFNRGDWAKAKEYLTRIDDKKLRWAIVFMITGADVLTDQSEKARDYFRDVCEVWEVWRGF
jgi:uncharacterized protein HemY